MLINMKNNLLWHKISPKLLGQEISYFCKKFLPVTRICFLWQEISSFYKKSSCGQKFLTVARNFLLWQEISYCGKKFLPVAKHFLLRKIYVCDNAWISANISCEPEDFVGAWLPGSLEIPPPCQHPLRYCWHFPFCVYPIFWWYNLNCLFHWNHYWSHYKSIQCLWPSRKTTIR